MKSPKNRLLEHLSGRPPQYHMFSFKAFTWCRTPKTEHRVPSSVNTPHVSLNLSQLSFINPSFSSLEPGALILVSTKWKFPKIDYLSTSPESLLNIICFPSKPSNGVGLPKQNTESHLLLIPLTSPSASLNSPL